VQTASHGKKGILLTRAVFATATCLSVCHTPVLCLTERKHYREVYTI